MAEDLHSAKSIVFAFSTNSLDREITNTLNLARRVEKAIHPDAPDEERQKIKEIIVALEGVAVAATGVECPNPFFGFFTVDKDKLMNPK